MHSELATYIADVVDRQFGLKKLVVLTRPDYTFGDFSTNVAMQLSADLKKNPKEIAEELVDKLKEHEQIVDASIAGPGFINLRVSDSYISKYLNIEPLSSKDETVLIEYSCPNAFKELHTGHLYQTLIGDAMARIFEWSGYKVFRTSFGGDVGLHAAKCMWGMINSLGGENVDKLELQTNRPAWISEAYVAGSRAYEEDESAKTEINELNRRIYEMVGSGEKASNFAKIFYTTRQWSYDYFNDFYESISAAPFDKYYPESEALEPGLNIVEKHKGTIFTESDGAVILDESKTGLHTRVFITSNGLPTYETKDLGVIQLENEQFPYDKRIVVTGNDQSEYMKVVFAALKLMDEGMASKQNHIANGTVKFADGSKMSSRLGNVSRAVDVIDTVMNLVEAKSPELKREIALGAVKYSLLKSRVGGDISFDIEQSISTEGNSGPYLQYALVRARSILRKAPDLAEGLTGQALEDAERKLALRITEFSEIIEQTLEDFSPHNICSYLYELAQSFNRFYENNRVIEDERSQIRLALVKNYEQILSDGLTLLGIPKPQEM